MNTNASQFSSNTPSTPFEAAALKSLGSAFEGSNPSPATSKARYGIQKMFSTWA
jgi:hypothetical protein